MAASTVASMPSQVSKEPPPKRIAPARSVTAPDTMSVNGHFASVGENGSANFEHGVQVIDEDKEFK